MVLWIVPRRPQHSSAGEPERFAPPSATQLRWGAGALRATFCNTAPLGSRSASRHLLQHSSAGEPERFAPPSAPRAVLSSSLPTVVGMSALTSEITGSVNAE